MGVPLKNPELQVARFRERKLARNIHANAACLNNLLPSGTRAADFQSTGFSTLGATAEGGTGKMQ